MVVDPETKALENRCRRAALLQGYVLQKSRVRDRRGREYGKFRLIDASTKGVVTPISGQWTYLMSLEQIEEFLDKTNATGPACG